MSIPKHERDSSKEDSTFGFLDENADERSRANDRPGGKDARYPVIRKPVPVSESGALRAPNGDAKGKTGSSETDAADAGDDFGFLNDIDLSPSGQSSGQSSASDFDDDWERPAGYSDDEPPRLWRRLALVVSVCALLFGSVLFSLPWLKQHGVAFDMPEELPFGLTLPFDIPGFGNESIETTGTEVVTTTPAGSETNSAETAAVPEAGVDAESTVAPSRPQVASLGSRFRNSLAEIDALVANERYDEADQAITSLDRSVYGYGATEFQALEARISQALGASAAAVAAVAEQEANAREAVQAREQARVQARVQAQVDAQEAEQARLAAEAALVEEARVRAELEQAARVAEARRLAQLNQAANDRQATDRAVAEQRAANERRAAAQQQQQEDEVAKAAEQSAVPVNRQITDADLQLVYGRFSDLAIAIETGNINDVISFTSRSSSRVQQFLQVFENSDFVSARITNVATRNALGSVTGTLSISGITRADGSTVDPPSNLRSIKLTSIREGDGWSLIDW